jgi:hypothetical protein
MFELVKWNYDALLRVITDDLSTQQTGTLLTTQANVLAHAIAKIGQQFKSGDRTEDI